MSFKKSRRELLDYPVEKGWRIRAYIEKLPQRDNFVLTIEHESEKDNIIRFDQSKHKHFHVDILGEQQKPFLEFPEAKSIPEKMDSAFKFIREQLSYIVKYKSYKFNLDEQRLKEIKETIEKELGEPKLGTRTTSISISSNANIINPDETN